MAKQLNNDALTELIAQAAAQAAAKATLEYLDKERQVRDKSKQDSRIRNTKLLLRHYRSFVSHCEDHQERVTAIQAAITLNELHEDEYAVESISRSKQRTMIMVQFIQRMMMAYRIMCERSSAVEDVRRYHIIEDLYMHEKKTTIEEVAEKYDVDPRTVFRNINEAADALSVLIFGIDAIRFE